MGKVKFKISSRTTILLGRENVSKADGALIELIKNSYDADANFSVVCFDVENDSLYLIDDGNGMNEEIITDNWMVIGTENKKNVFQSERGRIKSGEKGIGRFALDRLGSICELHTKMEDNNNVLYWKNDWTKFEESNKTLDDIEAELESKDCKNSDILPKRIMEVLANKRYKDSSLLDLINRKGTIIKISKLRDLWDEKSIDSVMIMLGQLIPPKEQNDFSLFVLDDKSDIIEKIDSDVTKDFDYKVDAVFDGEEFEISVYRNEFDIEKIPSKIFESGRFTIEPFRDEDFKKGVFKYRMSVSHLMNTTDAELIEEVKRIGPFMFHYIFMKMTLAKDDKEKFFFKEIGENRKQWIDLHGGIKIYRDNFMIRPYGDKTSNAYDWLGLDQRSAKSPAALSHKSESWKVSNHQGQGTLFVSRVDNPNILDKSSREGIIENETFSVLKKVIENILTFFEKDRAYIGRTFRLYWDELNEVEITKKQSKEISKKQSKKKIIKLSIEEQETLVKAVEYFEQEKEELVDEIKLLRSLASNGLVTTSIVHDLKSVDARLQDRSVQLLQLLKMEEMDLFYENMESLKNDDLFLHSWISLITSKKRNRKSKSRKNIIEIINDVLERFNPILKTKCIDLKINNNLESYEMRVADIDFDSIFYNLLINSVESFERNSSINRSIIIDITKKKEYLSIIYHDNGKGISDEFLNPNDIFEYGKTCKPDGTGLGMYIIKSTLREYGGDILLEKYKDEFQVQLVLPRGK